MDELSDDEILSSYEPGGPADDASVYEPEPLRWRRRADSLALLLLVAAVLGGAWLVVGRQPVPTTRAALAAPPVSTPTSSPPQVQGLACLMPGISCEAGRMRVAGLLALPVSFAPAEGVDTDDIAPGRYSVELRRTADDQVSGLTVVEEPVAVDGVPGRRVRSLVGARADRVAWWLASRPFVAPTTPEPVVVGGVAGCRVQVRMRDGASLPGYLDGLPAAYTFLNHGGTGRGETTAVSRRVHAAYYYLLDVPDHGLVVVWVWTWDGGSQGLAAMDAMVASLRFGASP